MPDGLITPPHTARQGWMALLARATRTELENALSDLTPRPSYTLLRAPEIGLAMVRGRAGGTGDAFNLGEMTMTRCAVRLDEAPQAIGHVVGHIVGLSYIVGRDARHAELAALFDAILQLPVRLARIEDGLLGDIRHRIDVERRARIAETAATRVDFFTLVREQGGE